MTYLFIGVNVIIIFVFIYWLYRINTKYDKREKDFDKILEFIEAGKLDDARKVLDLYENDEVFISSVQEIMKLKNKENSNVVA